jgi:hypothetical protein
VLKQQFWFLILVTVLVSATLFINVLVDADAKSRAEKIKDKAERQGDEITDGAKDTIEDIGDALKNLGK